MPQESDPGESQRPSILTIKRRHDTVLHEDAESWLLLAFIIYLPDSGSCSHVTSSFLLSLIYQETNLWPT